mmetsp:Transcript_64232/g.129115  ORF Transcript_64232/g.129115 Transcript_64232/m.129115 type:complete len:239 (-) Transcript_64232:2200-2916(-)
MPAHVLPQSRAPVAPRRPRDERHLAFGARQVSKRVVHEPFLQLCVAAVVLGKCFLNQAHPDLRHFFGVRRGGPSGLGLRHGHHQAAVVVGHYREVVVHHHRLPLPVLVQPHRVRPHLGVAHQLPVQNVHLVHQQPFNLFVHPAVPDPSRGAQHLHRAQQPGVLDQALAHVVRVGAATEHHRVQVHLNRRLPQGRVRVSRLGDVSQTRRHGGEVGVEELPLSAVRVLPLAHAQLRSPFL